MQQTKRRSKKGVILLALAFALLVLAIVPAAALAAPATITVNGVLGPNPVNVGSNLVTVKYQSDNINAHFVSFSVSPVPLAWGVEFPSPRKAYIPQTTDTETISLDLLSAMNSGDQFYVRVTFWDLATSGTLIEGPVVSGLITYTPEKNFSYLDLGSYGADGTVVPPSPVFPGPPWADYSTTWFGPHYTPPIPGTWVASGGIAQGDFTVFGVYPAHSVVYDVDGLYHADLELGVGSPQTPSTPANPIPFYGAGGILTKLGAVWSGSPEVSQGFHWVHHHAVSTTGSGDAVPEQYTAFGWDSLNPYVMIDVPSTGLSTTKWYGNAPIAWHAVFSDNPGSGVTTATVLPEFSNGALTPGVAIGTKHLAWTWWQSEASGKLVPAVNTADPLSWANSWDANNVGTVWVSFNATDAVLNAGNITKNLHFDLIAPHTTHTSEPVGATSFVWSPFWVNTDVKVTFKPMDPGFDDGLASGVDYTEYIIGSSTSTPPGVATKGEKATDGTVTIRQNAPTGPVYLWFRSVDKADPANAEAWQLIYVYIDKPTTAAGSAVSTGPVLENDVPSWWINDGPYTKLNGTVGKAVVVPELFGFDIWFNAYDVNSGIGPDLIRWRLPNWNNNAWFSDWHQIAPDTSWGPYWVHINAADDGIYALESKVKDRAGNETTLSTPLKIDTRAPVTDAAAGWVNGLEPYVLHAADQSIGAGVAATIYRVDQSIPWQANVATGTVGTEFDTSIPWVSPVQGAVHTVDFGSVDNALPYGYDPKLKPWKGSPSYVFGNLEGTSWIWGSLGSTYGYGFTGFTGYKTRNVKLDVTAPVVTAMDPKNGNWQTGPGTVNFSGTDVGAGYAYTEWSTDGGTTWTKGEVAQIGGDGEITVTYHGVDKVGIKSADQTIVVKVASTPPTVTAKNASVKKGQKATFKFTVTAVTPLASRVIIQIRTKSGRTLSSHSYADVTANAQAMRSFRINLPKGKYNIRIGAVDQAGNLQTRRGSATLTVK